MKKLVFIITALFINVLSSWGTNNYLNPVTTTNCSNWTMTNNIFFKDLPNSIHITIPKDIMGLSVNEKAECIIFEKSLNVTVKQEVVPATTNVIPTFNHLGPYYAGSNANPLPVNSLNGIPGNWNPDVINTSIVGTSVYIFTPTISSASQTSMTITINPAITQIGISQDIGTTVKAFWPVVPGAALYAFQYRPYGSSASWIGIGTILNYEKITNLTPGTHYECRIIPYRRSGYPMPGIQTGDFLTHEFPYTKDNDMGTVARINWPNILSWASSYRFRYKKQGAASWIANSTINPSFKFTTIPDSFYVCDVTVYIDGNFWGTTKLGEFKADSYGSSVDNVTGTSLDLKWTDLNTGDSIPWVVTQYVRYRVKNSNSAWSQKAVNQNTSAVHMTGLTHNTEYEFFVNVYLPSFWGATPLGYFKTAIDPNASPSNTNYSINIYPNPFVSSLNMGLFTPQESNIVWNIYDMTGKKLSGGGESIPEGKSDLSIDVESLPQGVYLLTAMMNDQMQSFRIMKL